MFFGQSYFFSFVLLLAIVAGREGGLVQEPSLVEVANGFTWAENLICLNSSLYVSENKRGEIWKVTYEEGKYVQVMLNISASFDLFAGLTKGHDGQLYALANPKGGVRSCQLIRIYPEDSSFEVIAELPRKCLGDGLGIYRDVFYSANEGDFVPLRGRAYSIRAWDGHVEVVVSSSFADDGVAVDDERGIVFVSEAGSPTHKVLALNATDGGKLIGDVRPKGVLMLDDFTVVAKTGVIVAADFLSGKIVQFPGLIGSENVTTTVLFDGITNPTSVRFGCVDDGTLLGLSSKLVFVTEGGGLTTLTKNRRVLAFPYEHNDSSGPNRPVPPG